MAKNEKKKFENFKTESSELLSNESYDPFLFPPFFYSKSLNNYQWR